MGTQNTYQNAMEWVGIAHNNGIRYALGKIKIDPKKKPNKAAIKKLVIDYFSAVGITSDQFSIKQNPNPATMVKSLQEKGMLTDDGSKFALTLLTILQNKMPLQTLLTEIVEQEHAASIKLHDRDLLVFQGLCAIARHSAQLWAPIEQGGEDFGNTLSEASKKRINWGEVLLADACGMECGLFGAVVFSAADIIIQMQ